MRLAAFAFLILVALCSPGCGTGDLTAPWPTPDSVAGIVPVPIALSSSDPFVPAEIGRARARTVRGLLYLPPGADNSHKVPAVVLLHGSAGMIAQRGAAYGGELASRGVAVLLVETYASRTDLGRSFLQRVLHITETMFVADAYAGLAALAARSDIDARHVALVGFSYGGMATTYALYAQMADALAPHGPRFAGHVAFYGPCIADYDDARTTGAPLLMLYGGRDELMDGARCRRTADRLRAGGSDVTITVYPNAVHQWDGAMAPRTIGRHLAACDFRVDAQGHVHDARTGLPMTGPLSRGVILALCTNGTPYPIGRDDAVRQQSDRDLGRFLERVFAR